MSDQNKAKDKAENNEKAKQWAGIIVVLENSKYLSMKLVINMAENVAQQHNLTWSEMSKILDHAHNNVDLDASEAFVDVVWK